MYKCLCKYIEICEKYIKIKCPLITAQLTVVRRKKKKLEFGLTILREEMIVEREGKWQDMIGVGAERFGCCCLC